jgi:hypothetical protein
MPKKKTGREVFDATLKNVTLDHVLAFLSHKELSPDECRLVFEAYKVAAHRSQRKAFASFTAGQEVIVKGSRGRANQKGTVVRFGRKNIVVDINGEHWRVSPSLLRPVPGKVSSKKEPEFKGTALSFKHEDETEGGVPVGPLWVRIGKQWRNYRDSKHVNAVTKAPAPDWFTLTKARQLAKQHNVTLEEH